MNEQEQFLSDIGSDQNKGGVDILDQPLIPEEGTATTEEGIEGTTTTEDDGDGDEEGLKPKNRRERRLMRKLDAERNSSMFLAGKLEAREEAKAALNEESDYLKGIERIYGTDSPEAQIATDLLKKAIVGARDDAEERAYQRIRSERLKEQQEVNEASNQLDGFIEEIEDTYDVSLTEAQEKAYFTLLQKMSPKNKDGEVTQYADPHAVWEIFQDKMKAKGTANPAKTLSSRSMVQSGTSKENNLQGDTTARFLKESGII